VSELAKLGLHCICHTKRIVSICLDPIGLVINSCNAAATKRLSSLLLVLITNCLEVRIVVHLVQLGAGKPWI